MKVRLLLTYLISLIASFFILEYTWGKVTVGLPFISENDLRHIPFIVATVVTLFVWVVWNFEIKSSERDKTILVKQDESIEKKKRERIDSVLRDLSDADLLRLRRRLLDGTIDDSHL